MIKYFTIFVLIFIYCVGSNANNINLNRSKPRQAETVKVFFMKTRKCIIKDGIVHIPLTKGYEAICDIQDYEIVVTRNWIVKIDKHTCYAYTRLRNSEFNGIESRNKKMHQFIIPDAIKRDHKNHNGLDNQRCNLRPCSNSQNAFNMKISLRGSSIYKGVYFENYTQKWRAEVGANNKVYKLGRFDLEIDAALAYNKKASELHGEFANLNIIN